MNAEAKLAAARTRLILEHPFIGALVMHLPPRRVSANRCRTFGSDARAFYYNPQYVDRLDLAQTQFALAHEALHCALGHFGRRAHRSPHRWAVACDHAANLLLTDEGLKPAPGALLDRTFRGLTAEEVYALIPADTHDETLDRHFGGGAGDAEGGSEPTAREREALERAWRERTVVAAQQARLAGRLPASWQRALDAFLSPRLPWRTLLARYLLQYAREDYSYERPSRREGDALLPRASSRLADVHVALDTSGSIAPAELSEFVSEIEAIKGELHARVTVYACDERLDPRAPWIFEPWAAVDLPRALAGGAGTSFVPVFEAIERACARPDALVYLTDGEGVFPARAPDYPVLWLVKGRASVPWGDRIELPVRATD